MKTITANNAEELLAARQHVLDVEKWLASEAAGNDLCGTLGFCVCCDKTQTHPCARAEQRFLDRQERELEEAAREQTALESQASASSGDLPEGYIRVVRHRRTFLARLIQNEKAQDFYTEIKNALCELSGVKTRAGQAGENYRLNGKKIAKLNIGGKTLTLYLALDPAAYEESKYRFSDVSDKKMYAETPMKLRITSKRAARHAKELIADLAVKYSVPLSGRIPIDYHLPYQTDEELIERGLIKPYEALVKKKKQP